MNSKKAKQIRAALAEVLETEETTHISKKRYNRLKFKTTRATTALKTWKARYRDAKRRYKNTTRFAKEKIGMEWRDAGYNCG